MSSKKTSTRASAGNGGRTLTPDAVAAKRSPRRKAATAPGATPVVRTTRNRESAIESEMNNKAAFDASHHHDEIAHEAYMLWVNRGCTNGDDFQDWVRAVEIVRQRYPE